MTDWRNIPVRTEILDEVEERARKENRSTANMVEVLLKAALEMSPKVKA